MDGGGHALINGINNDGFSPKRSRTLTTDESRMKNEGRRRNGTRGLDRLERMNAIDKETMR